MTNLSCTQAQQMTSNSDDILLRLAEKRRSVRQYTDEPVNRETIDKILTIAALAPSSYGQNPVEFVVVEGREQLSRLASCKRIGAPSVRGAAAAVVVMADTSKGELWVEDASVAAGYLLLGAEQYGIGACWNQIHLRDGQRLSASDEIRQLLDIPDRYEVLCVVSLGHKDEQKKPRSGEQMKQGRIRYGSDKEQIEALYREMYNAMVAKDTATLGRVHADNFVLIHMTGMRQSKAEYIRAIADGTLNYYSAEHEEMDIAIKGNTATLTGKSRVTAAVFGGSRGTWRLRLRFTLEKQDGQWRFTSSQASTY